MSLTVSVTGVSNVHLPEFPETKDPSECRWVSKNINGIVYGTVRFTENHRLEEKIEEREERTSEELDAYAQEEVGVDSWEDWKNDEELFGPLETWKKKTVAVKWQDMNYHGSFTFYTTLTSDTDSKIRHTYEARFTNGTLDNVILLSTEEFSSQ